jgi:energy-coupling factor transporter transmembrane protein EcfT
LSNRPSLFIAIAVQHAKLPFRRMWLVIPSAFVLGLAAIGWIVLRSSRRLDARLRQSTPFDARSLSRRLIQCSEALLCSGSYMLADVRLPAEGVKVTIRVV